MITRPGGSGDEAFASVLAAAQVGAAWACSKIWSDHAPAVAAFLSARGSREPDDVTSEVFLDVFARLPSFVGDATAFRSFVFSIAYRRLVDELRVRSRRGETLEYRDEADARRASSAEDGALESLADQRVRELIQSLAPEQRDVMLLRIIADLTVGQVADVLGKTEGAVKALQRRALAQLAKKVVDPRTPAGPSSDSGE